MESPSPLPFALVLINNFNGFENFSRKLHFTQLKVCQSQDYILFILFFKGQLSINSFFYRSMVKAFIFQRMNPLFSKHMTVSKH